MQQELSDKELVARAVARDKNAYRVLVERYQKKAFGLALEITGTREDAEDVVQEAFVKAYLSIASFKGQSTFYTWLYRIVYNMAIDVKRKRKRRGGDPLEYDETISSENVQEAGTGGTRFADPDQAATAREDLKLVQQVLAGLSEEHRTVIMLREVDGLAYDEIAKVLGISKGTVMSRLFYARKGLQKGLSALHAGESLQADESTEGDGTEPVVSGTSEARSS